MTSTIKYKKALFIYRRDLRIFDNIGLYNSLQSSYEVIPIFIFTPEQIINNKYKSDNCIQFMLDCLKDLNNYFDNKLLFFFDDNIKIINKLIKELNINAIFFNKDYTPYSLKRDKKIIKLCKILKIDCNIYEDYLLFNEDENEKTYYKFTPFYNNCLLKLKNINDCLKYSLSNKINKNTSKYQININILEKYYKINKNIFSQGGRKIALKLLNDSIDYKFNEDININTTHLSPYIKFGCISIREIYFKIKKNKYLVRQILWREFYYKIIQKNPDYFNKTIYNKNFIWSNNKILFHKFINGQTGYNIIDASINQLNLTGFINNRSRLLLSFFLIKVLRIDWKIGALYFANKLIDYDPIINEMNWRWMMGFDPFAQPYFRIFNLDTQTKRYDHELKYINKWNKNNISKKIIKDINKELIITMKIYKKNY